MGDSTHDHAKATGSATRTGKSKAGTIDADLAALAGRVTALEAEADHSDAYIVDLEARLGTVLRNHSDRLAALENPGPVVTPTPTGRIVQFPGTGPATVAALLALAKDLTVGVIEWQAGTYAKWDGLRFDVARPADKPLLVRPIGAVIWDGTGTINEPPWRIGWSGLLSNVTFDPSGTGTFTAQNYKLGKIGIVTVRYFDTVTFNGVIVRNVEGGYGDGVPGQQQHTHCVYVSSSNDGLSGNPRSKRWTSNNWDVVGPANRMLNGFQTDHAPNTDGVTANGWKVSSLHRAVYAYADPTNLLIDGWDIADCNATIDNYYAGAAQGIVRNCRSVRSGPMAPGQGSWKAGTLTGTGNVAS